MSKSQNKSDPKAIQQIEEDDTVADEVESVYDDDDIDDVDVDVDDNEQVPNKDDDDDGDDGDDGDDLDSPETVVMKKRPHVYHPIHDSTEIKIVAPDKRITSEYMTIYEYSMVVGTRATHISEGSVLYTDPQGMFDARDIAKKEIDENKCPLSITRKVSPSMIEIWEVNEMVKPQV